MGEKIIVKLVILNKYTNIRIKGLENKFFCQ